MGKIAELTVRTLPSSVVAWWRHWLADRQDSDLPLMDRLPEETFGLLREDLAAALESLEEHGIPVVLATHAQRFGEAVTPEERHMLVAWRVYYPPLKEDGFLDMEQRANQLIREAARSHGAVLADAARVVPPGPGDFADFVHFTNRGAEKMASLLAEELMPLMEPTLRKRLKQ
jgi:hypothetical protein